MKIETLKTFRLIFFITWISQLLWLLIYSSWAVITYDAFQTSFPWYTVPLAMGLLLLIPLLLALGLFIYFHIRYKIVDVSVKKSLKYNSYLF